MTSKLVEFGNYLKYLREDYGFTLSELGEEVGYSTAYLSQIEKGRRKKPATIDMLKQLSLALETPYSELLRKAGYEELAEGQYYKEVFSTIRFNKNQGYLSNDKRDGDSDDIKRITNFTKLHFTGILESVKDQRFNKEDTIFIVEHLSEMLLTYKEVIQKIASANEKWNATKGYLTGLWSEGVREEDIKQVFLSVELENEMNKLTKWIYGLPASIALAQKNNE